MSKYKYEVRTYTLTDGCGMSADAYREEFQTLTEAREAYNAAVAALSQDYATEYACRTDARYTMPREEFCAELNALDAAGDYLETIECASYSYSDYLADSVD